MADKGDELVAIVDMADKVRYVTERRKADRDNLRMRSARAIIFDPDMKIWIHRRALQKPVNSGLYDVGIAETPIVTRVDGSYAHESYEQAAKRGVSEEAFVNRVSIDDIVVVHLAKLPSIDIPRSPRNYDVFAFYYDPSRHGPITPEREEIEFCGFATEPELKELFSKEAFMGIAPVIAQLALYVIRNQGAIPINLKGVYAE